MFSQACVKNSVHRGGCLADTLRQADTARQVDNSPPTPSPRAYPLYGRQTPTIPLPLPTADGYCSGRYASYWDVFLLLLRFSGELCSVRVDAGGVSVDPVRPHRVRVSSYWVDHTRRVRSVQLTLTLNIDNTTFMCRKTKCNTCVFVGDILNCLRDFWLQRTVRTFPGLLETTTLFSMATVMQSRTWRRGVQWRTSQPEERSYSPRSKTRRRSRDIHSGVLDRRRWNASC